MRRACKCQSSSIDNGANHVSGPVILESRIGDNAPIENPIQNKCWLLARFPMTYAERPVSGVGGQVICVVTQPSARLALPIARE
jgi:hypothetical protein